MIAGESRYLTTRIRNERGERTGNGVEWSEKALGQVLRNNALAFSLSGFAGIVGIWLGGIATDKWGADRTLLFGVGAIVAAMIALWGLWAARPASLPVVFVAATVWGGMAFWNSPAIQARLHLLAGPVSGQALALNTSGTYLGVSIGAALGGLALTGLGVGALPLTAAGFALGALVLLAFARQADPATNQMR